MQISNKYLLLVLAALSMFRGLASRWIGPETTSKRNVAQAVDENR